MSLWSNIEYGYSQVKKNQVVISSSIALLTSILHRNGDSTQRFANALAAAANITTEIAKNDGYVKAQGASRVGSISQASGCKNFAIPGK